MCVAVDGRRLRARGVIRATARRQNTLVLARQPPPPSLRHRLAHAPPPSSLCCVQRISARCPTDREATSASDLPLFVVVRLVWPAFRPSGPASSKYPLLTQLCTVCFRHWSAISSSPHRLTRHGVASHNPVVPCAGL